MQEPRIVSMIRINGEWVNQDDIHPETVSSIVEKVLKYAGAQIGFDVERKRKEKTA
ncbi:MAG: hypothetical protein Q4D94_14635 [Bacillota bacterium]|nr:hypothetical protein [Bacillota bacterium]